MQGGITIIVVIIIIIIIIISIINVEGCSLASRSVASAQAAGRKTDRQTGQTRPDQDPTAKPPHERTDTVLASTLLKRDPFAT